MWSLQSFWTEEICREKANQVEREVAGEEASWAGMQGKSH